MKKSTFASLSIITLCWILFTNISLANYVDEILTSMSNEEKITQMIMPAFRKSSKVEINNESIKDIISSHWYAGVTLFTENAPDIESTIRYVDLLQNANSGHETRLLIAIDQEGGYVTRLWIWTSTPGNMALTATDNPNSAYNAAKIIGKELKILWINTDFAPVVDVNSNASNPIIGIRSFSDDPETVSTYAEQYMNWLHSEWIISTLKHFPWHGDTKTDTHTNLAIVEKTYDELKNTELIPFQHLINHGIEMIMTAHIIYPNIENETYISKKDGNTYTLPATLSKKFLTDILRKDMWYTGLIVTDSLWMAAISEQFEKIDTSIKAINAWVDILLLPFEYNYNKDDFENYIQTLASKIGKEISEDNVNSSVRKILELKEKKGLLEPYDNQNLEENIKNAKDIVSSKENHNEELEIAKKAVTMIKNNNNTLPINTEEKTVILYEYATHANSINNAITLLKNDGNIINESNIKLLPLKNNEWAIDLENIKTSIKEANNVIIIDTLYETIDLNEPLFEQINDIIKYVQNEWNKAIIMSTQLPYDVTKFKDADAIVLTYLANWIRFNLEEYEKELPKYWPNVIAGIYQMFSKTTNMNGVLPVDIYDIDNNNKFTNEIIYKRGFWLKYSDVDENFLKAKEELWDKADILNSLVPLFNDKDGKTKNDVKNLLKEFESSNDNYTKNIWKYFWYLVKDL